MNTQRFTKFILTLIGSLLIMTMVACTPSQPNEAGQGGATATDEPTDMPEEPTVNDLIDTGWDLVSIDGEAVTGNYTLLFFEDRFGGIDGCNNFGADYTIENGSLVVNTNNFMVTEMACMDIDPTIGQRYLEALGSAGAYTLAGDSLTVETNAGILQFATPVSADLQSTQWQLASLASDNDSMVSMAIDSNIHFQIEGDTVGGNSGCNNFNGSVTVTDNQISFNQMASTLMLCADEDVNNRETEFLAMLERVASYTISRQSLRLLDAEGAVIGEFIMSESMDNTSTTTNISDSKWSLIHTIVGGDAVVAPPYNTNIFLQFDGDKFSGNAGCNMVNGSITIEGNTLTFDEPMAITRRACSEEVAPYEMAFVELLGNVTSFEIDSENNILKLFNADGLNLAEFSPIAEKTFYIGSEQVDCVGVAPQKCLLVKENLEDEYTFFYSNITGFEWEAGFEYELLVDVTEVANPPADASSLKYSLVEVVNKIAVAGDDSGSKPATELVGTVWQWTGFEDTAGLNNITVADPTRYTIEFMTDGTYAMKNDCNSGSGTYNHNGSSLQITSGFNSFAACGGDSLEGDFTTKLFDVVTYMIQDGQLFMNLKIDTGNLLFSPAS